MQQVRANQRYANQKVTVQGRASTDGIYDEHGQLSFNITEARVGETSEKLAGTIGIAGFGIRSVNKGDLITATGKLYPTRGSRTYSISFAAVQVRGVPQPPIEKFRHGFTAGVYSALPEPLASFSLGLLIGQRSAIPKDLYDQLTMVGLTHIVAVSGYNLTIIVGAVRRLLGKRSKFQSLCLSLLLIAAFLAVTGLSASIVRAAIISGLSLLAWYYGRKIKSLVLILFTAAVTALWNPFYVWSDVGWYLSFLAFFGILVLAPAVTRRLFGERKPSILVALLLETTAAQVMTLPLIMFVFGRVSIIGLLANVLILPLVPLAMLASFIGGVAGMLVPAGAGWFAYPARLLLTYMVDLVMILARIPYALASVALNAPGMAFCYGCLVLPLLVWWRKSLRNGKITDTELGNV